MSSSQPFVASSPITGGRRRKSRFTYKQLAQLALSSTSTPLRVIAHVDLDAFYAQCESVRLGLPEDQPLAVQQWQGLIAINYPSRKFGLTRHINIAEAKKLCPNLIMQHVATWREGDTKWAYRDDAFKNISTDKVSLDPYRLESRKILACIKETLPAKHQKVEKAGIDEVFLDLSTQIHSILLERYPELSLPAPYDDPTENLPLPPTTVLDWQADALVDLDSDEAEEEDPDWDDIAILIGSEIIRDIRAAVYKKLKYTCSGGVAQNKMLSKLGSAHKKPNQQTVIRNRAVQQFLSGFKYGKIRGLGGKLGEQVQAAFDTETVGGLIQIPIEQLKQKLGDESGTWLYQIIRGTDSSEVNPRTQLQSMLSAKSFRPTINTPEQATKWLRIFVADIYARLVEEGVIENKRRPKSMILHHRQGGQTRSRSIIIPQGKRIDEGMLLDLANNLLGQIILEGRVWPCANLSLAVGGFEEGVAGNMGIGAFLVKGEQAKALNNMPPQEPSHSVAPADRPGKRRKLDNTGISRFFPKSDSMDEHDDEYGQDSEAAVDEETLDRQHSHSIDAYEEASGSTIGANTLQTSPHQHRITEYMCNRCNMALESAEELQSHQDWHFAKDLQDEDNRRPGVNSNPTKTSQPKKPNVPAGEKKVASRSKPEKGQSKLAFG
ncbi:putative DNA polymerase kappa [Coleophoma cylindrospora]|uniref:DNA polymerase eta n=1 Tax=Coleophoma cylindrospora TaxID=1849047 RepID=A0A3D8QKE0_9HELO|nr:putative DNA polymerase kappa [Coleophoma cylindrospora]